MKTKLLSAFCFLLSALALPAQTVGLNAKISSAEPKTMYVKWVALTTGTNVVCSTTNLQFTAATFYGIKSSTSTNAPTANTDSAYLGMIDPVAGETANNATITAGSYVQVQGTGTKYNLKDFTVTGTTGDKVMIVYEQ